MKVSKPNRVTRTYTQHIQGTQAEVFPLLCPVREAEWIPGWDPIEVLSESGVAEADCVFRTAAESGESIWYVTRHERQLGIVEMIRITPEVTACRLNIEIRPAGDGSRVAVTYSHTSLGPDGDAFLAGFTEDHYHQVMRDWEALMNRYLGRSGADN